MFNKNILAIIPARSGSKGLPGKNIRLLNDIPLIGHAGLVANACEFIDNVIISTDSEQYQEIARQYNIATPFTRPVSLSGDMISDIQILRHALKETELFYDKVFDIIIMLQPTSPFRSVEIIRQAINKLIEDDLDAVWTVSEIDKKFNPLKQLKIRNGILSLYDNQGSKIMARQQLESTYIRNGQCYTFTRKAIAEYSTIFPKRTGYLVTPNYPNIDSLEDFEAAENLLNLKLKEE